jgi:hypothetical protein
MENKQTAVEFLVEQITKHTWYDEEGFGHVSVSILDIEQAKQIEKEQICNAYRVGWINYSPKTDSEQYYNETYGGNK